MNKGKFGQNKTCRNCGKEIFGESTTDLCRDCISKEVEQMSQVRQYVFDHQEVSLEEVSEATGISDKALRNMMKSGFFASNKKSGHGYPCQKCGKIIRRGLYCGLCLARMRSNAMREGAKVSLIDHTVPKPVIKPAGENKILVIDDDELYLDMAKMILERKLSCKVLTANNGLKGLEIMRKHAIKLVLLDIAMPVMDGLKTLEMIRENVRFKSIPVIMLTASTKRESVTKAVKLGVTDYVSKPFIPEQLIERVNKNLDILKEEEEKIPNILLIDDDMLDSRTERKILEKNLFCKLTVVPSGVEGMQELKEGKFDLALVSLEMPFVDGLEILEFIRRDEKINQLPEMIMIPSKDESFVDKVNQSKANGYIVKPEFTDDDLHKISKVLNRIM